MKKTLFFLSLLFTLFANAQAESYYNDVDLNAEGIDLRDKLAAKTISAHTNFLTYTPGVWQALQVTDLDPNNPNNVLLIYGWENGSDSDITNDRSRNKNTNGGSQGDWNREHTFANSLANPNLDSSGRNGTPFSDAHNLRSSDVQRNGFRGNRLFADGSGNARAIGANWYPGDEWKGDVARITMYMYLRYGAQCLPRFNASGTTNSVDSNMINLLLEWNAEDPVSAYEDARNTYHEANLVSSQGNRNPFIDNPYLATRIWGGTPAEDRWGIYTSTDTEAPTTPTNIVLNNITTSTIDATWTASTDNEAVTKYEVFANGILNGESVNTNYTLINLVPNTNYSITVLAKDIANNTSAQSNAANASTLADTIPPTVPTNITITNQTATSFKVNWQAATDNSRVANYSVFVDGILNGTTTNTNYDVTGLTTSTSYSVTVSAKDAANNSSAQSTAVNATTSDGTSDVTELFFSEYIEGNSFNKAIEIVNLTSNNVNLSPYTVKRQSNGVWETPLQLQGTISINDVYVIINLSATNPDILREQDLGVANTTPMTFNGDDRIGLFKNDVLIDIIGDLDGTDTFAENKTLRRNTSVKGPNTVFNEQGEWSDFFSTEVVYSDIGNFNGTLSVTENNALEAFKIFPNPTNGNTLNIKTTSEVVVTIYNVLGKLVTETTITNNANKIDISNLSKGIYLIKLQADKKFVTKKLIKN